jgi:cytochrome c oxidase assembly protein subunit 11
MKTAADNRRTFVRLAVFAAAMFGFGFAMVPLYRTFCEITGINQLQQADPPLNTQVDASRTLTVELDANVRGELPWSFRPLERVVKVHPGELTRVSYEIRNDSAMAVTGQAIPSYGPRLAAAYFRKLECFCFTRMELGPGETRRIPVVFVIDPALPGEVNTVTLSYSFFEVEGARRAGAGAPAVGG